MSKNNTITLKEFLEHKYKMLIEPYEDVEYNESGYIITCPELVGVKVFGETLKEAFEELEEAKIAYYEMKTELGEDISIPVHKERPSGRVTLRLPISMHERVIEQSELNKTSLNATLVNLIGAGLTSTDFKVFSEKLSHLTREVIGLRKNNDEIFSSTAFDFNVIKHTRYADVTDVHLLQELGHGLKKDRIIQASEIVQSGSRVSFKELSYQ